LSCTTNGILIGDCTNDISRKLFISRHFVWFPCNLSFSTLSLIFGFRKRKKIRKRLKTFLMSKKSEKIVRIWCLSNFFFCWKESKYCCWPEDVKIWFWVKFNHLFTTLHFGSKTYSEKIRFELILFRYKSTTSKEK